MAEVGIDRGECGFLVTLPLPGSRQVRTVRVPTGTLKRWERAVEEWEGVQEEMAAHFYLPPDCFGQ